MRHRRSFRIRRAIAGLVVGGLAAAGLLLGAVGPATAAGAVDPHLAGVAREARQVIAVIDWFYVQHRACPQPSRPVELAALRAELGDGYSAEPQGQFVTIRGISMASGWLYYTSPKHPAQCTLWRKLGWDPALIWRRDGNITRWSFDPGDGNDERPIKLAP